MLPYERIGQLGEGTYAKVYKARHPVSGLVVALKVIDIDQEEGTPSTAIREISLMKALKHRNVIALYDVLHEEEKLTLVFEYCSFDLRKFMDMHIKDAEGRVTSLLDEGVVMDLMYQMMKGVAHCHENRVLHRDLKPQNILITREGVLKLADFGLARAFGTPVNTFSNEVVTLWYRPPDVLMGSRSYGPPIDVWSCGCIFGEMMSGVPLFRGRDNDDQLRVIFQVMGTPDQRTIATMKAQSPEITKTTFQKYNKISLQKVLPMASPQAVTFLDKLLQHDPSKRISAADAVKDTYFAPAVLTPDSDDTPMQDGSRSRVSYFASGSGFSSVGAGDATPTAGAQAPAPAPAPAQGPVSAIISASTSTGSGSGSGSSQSRWYRPSQSSMEIDPRAYHLQ